MGVSGSVSYMYDNLAVVNFSGLSEEEILELMIENEIDVDDIEELNDSITIYAKPTSLYEVKEAISKKIPDINFNVADIEMLPKETVELNEDDTTYFEKLLTMLEDIEDVKKFYHNVILK